MENSVRFGIYLFAVVAACVTLFVASCADQRSAEAQTVSTQTQAVRVRGTNSREVFFICDVENKTEYVVVHSIRGSGGIAMAVRGSCG